MKKLCLAALLLLMLLALAACGGESTTIEIIIPPYNQEDFIYSDTVFTATTRQIRVSPGAGISDAAVLLQPVQVSEKTEYQPVYITRGMESKIAIEKGGQYRIGINVQNGNGVPIAVSVEVDNIRINAE